MNTSENLHQDPMTAQVVMSTLLVGAAALSSHFDFARPARAKA
ncbi:hypothetical protein [Methylomonas sp.]|nr:hypothetical protein [Methylomonas sp.]